MKRQTTYVPIPELCYDEDYAEIEVSECGEPLVDLATVHPRIHVQPMYFELGIPGAITPAPARHAVATRLLTALKHLPEDVDLLVWDAWRPPAVQQWLFDDYKAKVAAETGLAGEALLQEVRKFVALPSSNSNRPSSHVTGGAIDITLSSRDGRALDLGTAFDEFSERAETRYYEDRGSAEEECETRDLRRVLYHAMVSAGFVNYPLEWWHYSHGDLMHARMTGNRFAKYGEAVWQGDLQPGCSYTRGLPESTVM